MSWWSSGKIFLVGENKTKCNRVWVRKNRKKTSPLKNEVLFAGKIRSTSFPALKGGILFFHALAKGVVPLRAANGTLQLSKEKKQNYVFTGKSVFSLDKSSNFLASLEQ